MKKRFLSFVMVLCMLAAFVPCVQAATIVDSGSCGDNVTWTLDEAGTLTISGSGDMADYNIWQGNNPVWSSVRQNILSVVINDGVTSIGSYAFYDCNYMTNVTIPNGVTSIGKDAFGYCRLLKEVNMPNTITSIGTLAFQQCNSLTSVTLSQSITSIGAGTFSVCQSLNSIIIPDDVTSIGNQAFFECISLKSIDFSENLTFIDEKAFEGCTSLESVSLPNNITTIGRYAFSRCGALKDINIPSNMTSISQGTFAHCKSLTSVSVPNNITLISDYAFYWCDSLRDVYFSGSLNEWNKIDIKDNNERLDNATIHYNAIGSKPPRIEGTPSVSDNKLNIALDDTEYESNLITVFFNDNTMVSFETTLLSAGDTSKSITVPSENITSAKVFVWDSLSGMKPLCDAVTIEEKNFVSE